MFLSLLSSLFSKKTTTTVSFLVRNDNYYRATLMCKCISAQTSIDFTIEDFSCAIYKNFIYMCVKGYNPDTIFMLVSSSIQKDMLFDIFYDGKKEIGCIKADINFTKLEIDIDNEDIEKLELIMNEMKEIYYVELTIEELISNIFTNYIMKYLTGELALYKLLYKYAKSLIDEEKNN